jgi:hypothetical protein
MTHLPLDFRADLLEELREPVRVPRNGRLVSISRQRLIVQALVERGSTGDLAAIKLITHLLGPHVEPEVANEGPPGETILEAFWSQHKDDPVVQSFIDALLAFQQPRAVTEQKS